MLLANPEGDRKGPRFTPLLSRPYKDMQGLRQKYPPSYDTFYYATNSLEVLYVHNNSLEE